MSTSAPRRLKERHTESIWSRYTTALKLHRLSASLLAVCVGGALAIGEPGYSRWPLWAAVAFSALLIQLGGRLLLSAVRVRRARGSAARKATEHGLSSGGLSFLGAVSLIAACICGFIAVIERGWDLFWLGVAAILGTINYAQGLALRDRALGEAVQFFLFGPFPVVGAYLAVTGVTSPLALQVSIPLGFLAAAGTLVAGIRDAARDTRAQTFSVASLLGRRRAELLYLVLVAASYGWLLVLVFRGLLAPICLLPLLTLYQAVQAYVALRRRGRSNSEKYTALLDASERLYIFYAVLYAVSIAASHLIVERAI